MLLPFDFFYIFDECLELKVQAKGVKVLAETFNLKEDSLKRRKTGLFTREKRKLIRLTEETNGHEMANALSSLFSATSYLFSNAREWKLFCLSNLSNQEPFLPKTTEFISQSARKDLSFLHSLQSLSKSEVNSEVLKKLREITTRNYALPEMLIISVSAMSEEQELAIRVKWACFEAVLCFLAHAEAEYCIHYRRETESAVTKLLPMRTRDGVITPVEFFFRKWFANLEAGGVYKDEGAIATEIEWERDLDPESVRREMRRYMNSCAIPSWPTVESWFEAIVPDTLDGSQIDKQFVVSALHCTFAGARILDKTLREYLSSFDNQVEFEVCFNRYNHWFSKHLSTLQQGVTSQLTLL